MSLFLVLIYVIYFFHKQMEMKNFSFIFSLIIGSTLRSLFYLFLSSVSLTVINPNILRHSVDNHSVHLLIFVSLLFVPRIPSLVQISA